MLSFLTKKFIELLNIVLTRGCDSNLILLGQINENGITHEDNLLRIILIKNGKVIANATRSYNLFIFDCTTQGKVILLYRKNKSIHLVSQNKRIRIWHQRHGHTSNT